MMTAGDEVAYHLDERVHLTHIGGVSSGSLARRLRRIAKMRRVFKSQRDATIISFGPGTSFFTVMAAAFLGNRIIISERNDPAVCPHPFLRNLIYRRASRLVFQTGEAAECFPRKIRERGCVIANPLSEDLPLPRENAGGMNHAEHAMEGRALSMVAVGRLEAQKNYPLLLEAFARFLSDRNDVVESGYQVVMPPPPTLTICGDGSLLPQLQKKAASLGIAAFVTFAGFCADVWGRVGPGTIYILSSDYEGMPNSLLEAMALGLPVIATDCPIGGPGSLIRDGENGLLTPCGDATALAAAMSRLAGDPDAAARMGRAAVEVRELYSAARITEKWLGLLRE